MLKRPKSDGRCIHCREALVKKTKDHVFPSSWYPDSTPLKLQRWTVPSCERCNCEFGSLEKELFVRLALCIDPRKAAAAGISKRAIRSLGIGVAGISDEERRHRQSLKEKVFARAKPVSSSKDLAHVLPGLGPHPEASPAQQLQISIPEKMLAAVAKKIVRGCEYWLANGRIIEPPYEIDLMYVRPENLPVGAAQLVAVFGRTHLGPGLRIRRGGAHDDSGTAMFEIMVWDSLPIYAAILPPDTEPLQSNNVA
jgi:hypothetical protein